MCGYLLNTPRFINCVLHGSDFRAFEYLCTVHALRMQLVCIVTYMYYYHTLNYADNITKYNRQLKVYCVVFFFNCVGRPLSVEDCFGIIVKN